MEQAERPSELDHRVPVLHFDGCVLPLTDAADETLSVDLAIAPTELVMVHTEDRFHEDAFVQAAGGITSPLSGTVRFLGNDWRRLMPDRSNAARGRIGIVFRNESWIPYLSVMESMILPQMHHTRRSFESVYNDAAHWASLFGLPGLPRDLPAATNIRDRQRAGLARAFIGGPALIVVEHQSRALSAPLLETLINAMRDVRERDGAVLWFSRDISFCLDPTIPATRRIRLDRDALRTLEPAA